MPTKWPCDRAIACPCSDNPLGNFSSELPDPFTFFARRFFPLPEPCLDCGDGVFVAQGCGRACFSTISQADADACALRDAVMCTQPPPPGEPGDPVLFGNRAVSCQADCPEGPPFILNIAPGTYLARTQELADLIAQSFCQADVIQFRHCEMPPMPPPPSAICPHITSQTASPINANDGDNVTMTVNYTYNSPMMLMFVWFKDGVATYPTSNSSLTLNAVSAADDGQYILGIFASGCFPVFSSPIQLNVTSACPPEAGPNAPDSLTILHPVEWETWTVRQVDLSVVISSTPGCNPTGLLKFTPTNGLDHPPGNYGYRYLDGVLRRPALDGGCGANRWREPAGDAELDILNQEHNVDAPASCSFQVISGGSIAGWFLMPGDPPPGAFSGALGGCFASAAAASAAFQFVLTPDYVHVSGTYPPDMVEVFPHTNTGGNFFGYITDYGEIPAQFIEVNYSLKVIQLEGQPAQPRKVKIDSFGTVAADFSDPAVAANWDGKFPTRTTYTSSVLLWTAAASGGFGGATIEYITTHPTSPNGKGWRMKVFAGATLVWQGLAGRGETPITRFYKDSLTTPVGPDCLTCSDDSTLQWFP